MTVLRGARVTLRPWRDEDLTPFARPDQIAHLFTDSKLASEWVAKLNEAGVDFTICEEEAVSNI